MILTPKQSIFINFDGTPDNSQPSPQLQTKQNSQTPTFSPQNLSNYEVMQINEALKRYGISDKEYYLKKIDDAMLIFKDRFENRLKAVNKFTQNSGIYWAMKDFDKAIKQQERIAISNLLSFAETNIIRDFTYRICGTKLPLRGVKERVGTVAPLNGFFTEFLITVATAKYQILQTCGEKLWQETFENFQKTNDLKVFENAIKSQIPNENVNLKNSENNITNPQENGNDFKM